MKKCQFCAEEVQDEAVVCKHCGRDLNVPTPRNSAVVRGQMERKVHKYISYDYQLISKTDTDAVMVRRSPVNAILMIALVLLFWPAAIVYAFPGVRKEYRVQLSVQHDGRVDEYGGDIMTFERDKKKANTTGIVFLILAILLIIVIVF